jgi:HNH endonuclease
VKTYKVRRGKKRPHGMPLSILNDTVAKKGPLPTLCRVWKWASKPSTGGNYGSFRRRGVHYHPHRYFYEQENGPIPPGLEIDHLCRNTICVNPVHLEPVTRAENGWRGTQSKLTKNEVRVLRLYAEHKRSRGQNLPEKALALAFGVHRSTLSQIILGKRWGKLDDANPGYRRDRSQETRLR